ncbi:MAG TPA: trypsin-like peptidase domain-containing protein [Syntrophorhabdaceae bacterium]|nr:trypsin-like peptidase domain-containing protein [Syntrophorhabdaceae bacterium]
MPSCHVVRGIILVILCCAIPYPIACTPVAGAGGRAFVPPSGPVDPANSFVAVVREVGPSVVSIRAERVVEGMQLQVQGESVDEEGLRRFLRDMLRGKKRTAVREASGLVMSREGHILTNHHVVADAFKITVQLFDGTVLEGTIVGADSKTDLALLRVEAAGLKVPALGDSDRIEPGEWAIAIGSPYGFQRSVTTGVISGKGRAGTRLTPASDLIQTDASINPGNSGGPLVNIRGEVIGINSMVIRPGQGIGFAIPINVVKRVVGDLIAHGRVLRSWVGLGLQEMTPEIRDHFGLDRPGALVRQVIEKSPSDRAGLKAGDVIVSIDGKEAANTQIVMNEVLEKRIGQTVKMEVIRNGKRFSTTVTTVDEEVGVPEEPPPVDVETKRPFGLEVRTITPGIAQKLERPELEGVVIIRVGMGSPASTESLMRDDVILSVDGRRIKDEKEYEAALKKVRPEKGALMMIDRWGSTFFVVLREG